MELQKQLRNEVFVDTAALVAQINNRDNLHIKAISINQKLVLKGIRLITSMFIMDYYKGMLLLAEVHRIRVRE